MGREWTRKSIEELVDEEYAYLIKNNLTIEGGCAAYDTEGRYCDVSVVLPATVHRNPYSINLPTSSLFPVDDMKINVTDDTTINVARWGFTSVIPFILTPTGGWFRGLLYTDKAHPINNIVYTTAGHFLHSGKLFTNPYGGDYVYVPSVPHVGFYEQSTGVKFQKIWKLDSGGLTIYTNILNFYLATGRGEHSSNFTITDSDNISVVMQKDPHNFGFLAVQVASQQEANNLYNNFVRTASGLYLSGLNLTDEQIKQMMGVNTATYVDMSTLI